MSNVFTIVGVLAVMLPVMLGMALLVAIWRAWWFYPAWAWFVVPLGVPQIAFWHFAALLIFVNAATAHFDEKKDERKTDWAKVATAAAAPIFAWVLLRMLRPA